MSHHRYPVTLTPEQRDHLSHLIRTGKPSSFQQVVARVLLKLDRSQPEPAPADQQIAEALETSRRTVIRIKERFVSEGLDATLSRKYPQTRPERRRITGQEEAHLIALTCGPVPDGQQRWTLRLLADKMVQWEYVDQISYETIRQVLKKRTQAVVEAAVVLSQSHCRVCVAHGRYPGCVLSALRPASPADLHGCAWARTWSKTSILPRTTTRSAQARGLYLGEERSKQRVHCL